MPKRVVPKFTRGPPLRTTETEKRFSHLNGRGEGVRRLLFLPLKQEPYAALEVRLKRFNGLDIGRRLNLQAHIGNTPLATLRVNSAFRGLVINNHGKRGGHRIDPRAPPTGALFRTRSPDRRTFAE